MATPQRCTKAFTGNHRRYAWPTSDTQKRFFQLHSHHGFNTLTPPKDLIHSSRTFLEHDISVRVLLEKRHQHLRREQLDPDLSILVQGIHSRHYIVNAGELGLMWWVDKNCMVRHYLE